LRGRCPRNVSRLCPENGTVGRTCPQRVSHSGQLSRANHMTERLDARYVTSPAAATASECPIAQEPGRFWAPWRLLLVGTLTRKAPLASNATGTATGGLSISSKPLSRNRRHLDLSRKRRRPPRLSRQRAAPALSKSC